MAGRIPREFIDDLLARADIVALVDERVRLKKAGKNYSACCPFHGEKTPSFTVSPDKQFYHCFGCGAHGNAIDFLMEYERLEFPDAVEELAGMLGMEVVREQSNSTPGQQAQARQVKEDGYELLGRIAKYYQHQLKHHANAAQVIAYLKGRGLTGEIAKQWQIGYAPDGWDGVLQQFARTQEQKQLLVQLGMLIKNDQGRYYDRFRDRLMFPILDKRGRVIGFGGRVLGEGTPKYLNSPETPLFHKGLELYGLYKVKEAHRNPAQILIVEGYMDVVGLAQAGVDYAVASLGTSTTREQLQTLLRMSDKLVFCYDGDNAGREAAWRALENALPLLRDGTQLLFAFLPDGEDPDSLVKQVGKQAFEQTLQQARPLSEFFFEHLLAEVDDATPDGKTKLARLATPLIEKMPEGVLRTLLEQKLAHLLGIQQQAINKLIKPAAKTAVAPQAQKLTPLRLAIALVVQHPQLGQLDEAQAFGQSGLLSQLDNPGATLLTELLTQTAQQSLTTAQLLERWREHESGPILAKLAHWDLHVEQEQLHNLFFDSLEKLLTLYLEQRTEQLLNAARQRPLSDSEKAELKSLLEDARSTEAQR